MKKNRWNSGETIVEVLAAMLVVTLASVLFATMVMTSYRIIRQSASAYEEYMNAHNEIESESGEAADAQVTIRDFNDNSLKITTSNYDVDVDLYQTSGNYDYFIYEDSESE